jgi:hypothetical protein
MYSDIVGFTYKLHSKGGRVSFQSSIGPFRYRWIHLHAAMIKEDSVSHQTSINLFRYCWIHLQAKMSKEDSVSCQSMIV